VNGTEVGRVPARATWVTHGIAVPARFGPPSIETPTHKSSGPQGTAEQRKRARSARRALDKFKNLRLAEPEVALGGLPRASAQLEAGVFARPIGTDATVCYNSAALNPSLDEGVRYAVPPALARPTGARPRRGRPLRRDGGDGGRRANARVRRPCHGRPGPAGVLPRAHGG